MGGSIYMFSSDIYVLILYIVIVMIFLIFSSCTYVVILYICSHLIYMFSSDIYVLILYICSHLIHTLQVSTLSLSIYLYTCSHLIYVLILCIHYTGKQEDDVWARGASSRPPHPAGSRRRGMSHTHTHTHVCMYI